MLIKYKYTHNRYEFLHVFLIMFRNKFMMAKSNEAKFKGDGYISLDTTNFYTDGESSTISLRIRPVCGKIDRYA